MSKGWQTDLARWIEAGLLDEEAAARIRAFEMAHPRSSGLRWPVWIALAAGGLMLGAGVLLFVSAHWDTLSPLVRFALIVALVAVFHVAGGIAADRFPAMSSTMHAVGTVALGAGIFLAGQVFNLDEHWPGGLMLWALGSVVAWTALHQSPQLALSGLLVPAWLFSEWLVATTTRTFDIDSRAADVAACGTFLLAVTYFTSPRGDQSEPRRRTLMWLGGLLLLPAALFLVGASASFLTSRSAFLSIGLRALGWTVAIGLPWIVAIATRGTAAWPTLIVTAWILTLLGLRSIAGDLSLYVWWALGAMALVAWGVREARSERINMGSAIFGLTVVAFYFSQVMDKLGRSLSLVGFGILFLAGGWALERVRRRLVQHTRGGSV